MRRSLAAGLVLGFLSGPLLPLVPLAPQISQDEYAARRAAVAERMGSGVLLAFGAPSPVTYEFQFRQLPAFNYLTGFMESNAAMVLVHEEGEEGMVRWTIFTERPTVRTQLYDGFREDPEELASRVGASVRPLEELERHVDSLASSGLPFFELRDFASSDYAEADSLTRGGAFVKRLQARHPVLEITDIQPWVSRLRGKKSEAEVELLREAIAITDEAHRAALAVIEPGAWEYQVEAAIEHAFRSRGADGPAFSGIVGSGLNSTVLHYVDNDRRMEAGDVILMDIGAQVEGYAADITRTVPVSGVFSPDQRAIYDLVLASHEAAAAEIRPGASAQGSLLASMRVRLLGLEELGLIQAVDATFDPPWPVDCEARPDQCLQGMLFMIHGISHGIGLEVHDPSQFSFDGRFGVGDVFTIEPGIYVNAEVLDLLPDTPENRAFVEAVGEVAWRYHGIGVRIEDDYLVVPGGVVRLSHAPRSPEEIEAVMAGEGMGRP